MVYARYLFLCLCWFFFILIDSFSLLGQSWSADLSQDGEPSSTLWRYDTGDFLIQDGWLSLNAPREKGTKLLVTSVQLPERMHWSGVVRFDESVSTQNHAYVLLGCSAVNKAMGAYTYLALSLGGGARGSVALVRLFLNKPTTQTSIRVLREEVLIDVGTILPSLYSALGYDVWYDGQERIVLSLSQADQVCKLLFRAETEYSDLRSGTNGFGILCYFTATRHRSMHFAKLRIDRDFPISPDSEENPEMLVDDLQPLLLTEVMANPLANSPEYVELYNPNEGAVSLGSYHLAIGSNVDKMKDVYLPMNEEVEGKSYVVVCSSPKDLYATYPHCPQGAVRFCSLPRMANTGCTLILYKDEEVVDRVTYDPTLLGRGLKTKRGVALERIGLERDSPWHGASQASGYASPGEANGRGETASEVGHNIGIKELLELKRKEPKSSLSLHVYYLNGTQALKVNGEMAQALMQRLADSGLGLLVEYGLRRRELYLLCADLLDERGVVCERMVQTLSVM